MKFFAILCCFRQNIISLPLWLGKRNMGSGQFIHSNILLKTYFFDSLRGCNASLFSLKFRLPSQRFLLPVFSTAQTPCFQALRHASKRFPPRPLLLLKAAYRLLYLLRAAPASRSDVFLKIIPDHAAPSPFPLF